MRGVGITAAATAVFRAFFPDDVVTDNYGVIPGDVLNVGDAFVQQRLVVGIEADLVVESVEDDSPCGVGPGEIFDVVLFVGFHAGSFEVFDRVCAFGVADSRVARFVAGAEPPAPESEPHPADIRNTAIALRATIRNSAGMAGNLVDFLCILIYIQVASFYGSTECSAAQLLSAESGSLPWHSSTKLPAIT